MKPAVQNTPAKLLDVIAVLEDQPALSLIAGQVGTIVEELAPDVFEVEFLDRGGRMIACVELGRRDFLILHHEPAVAV